jgi:hypothetical protein
VALAFLLFAALGGLATLAAYQFPSTLGSAFPGTLFTFAGSWQVAYLIGAAMVLRRALRRPAPGLAAAAADWPRSRLNGGLAGAALAFGLTWWNLDLAARADLAVARQEAGSLLRDMGPPPVSAADDATRLYVEAGKGLPPSFGDPWREAIQASQPSDGVNWKDPYVVELVAQQEPALALLRKAAALPPCDLGGGRSLENLTVGGDLEQLRARCVQLLAIDARVKAAQGQRQRAFEDVAAMLGTTNHVPAFLSGPALLGTPIRAWRTLEDVLRLAPAKEPPPPVAFPETMPPLRALTREMACFAMICPVFFSEDSLRFLGFRDREEAAAWTTPPVATLLKTVGLPGGRIFLVPAELATAHRHWEAYRRLLRSAPEGTPEDWATVQQLVADGPRGIYGQIFMRPKEQRLFRDAGEGAALKQLAHTALAAAHFRGKHGKYPERLEQLVPEFLPALPADPRDGRPVQVRHFAGLTVLFTLASDPELAQGAAWDADKYQDRPVFRLTP